MRLVGIAGGDRDLSQRLAAARQSSQRNPQTLLFSERCRRLPEAARKGSRCVRGGNACGAGEASDRSSGFVAQSDRKSVEPVARLKRGAQRAFLHRFAKRRTGVARQLAQEIIK